MSHIYTDDNIHEALEKVAGRAGNLVRAARQAVESNRQRLAQEVSRQANPKTLKGNLRVAAQESGGNLQAGLRALQAQPGKVRSAQESLASFNRQFKAPGRIPTAGNASARALQRSKQSAKPLASRGTFGLGGNKVKVASDDNIYTALEKVAMSKRLKAAAGGGLMAAGLYGAYKTLSGKRSKYHEPDPAKMDARIEAIARKAYESQYKK